MSLKSALRIAVVGHVEHVTLGRVTALPHAGDIVHLEDVTHFPGGGGGVAFFQLTRSAVELHLFSAVGNDDTGATIAKELRATGANVHLVERSESHTRDVVMVTPDGERSIVVVGQPLHPRLEDPLPWEILSTCDAVYFTAQDPGILQAARSAKKLIVTARRREALNRSGVTADVVLGSSRDPNERSNRLDYAMHPTAVVLTEGSTGGWIETVRGRTHFNAPAGVIATGGAYGAGDSFAGAFTYFSACGYELMDACERAAHYGAAVLTGLNPLVGQIGLDL